MSVVARGTARIKHRETGEIYEIGAAELDWQEGAADEREMGSEVGHFADIEHPELGRLSWELWEYPLGMENMQEVNLNGHVLVDNFRISLDPGREPDDVDDDDDDDAASRIDGMVEWFHANYEDPAERTPYESAEGGYQWIWGGPFDAREELSEQFPDEDPRLVELAVRRIERDGLHEWAPVASRDDYDAPEEETDSGDDDVDLYDVAEGLRLSLLDIPRRLTGPAFEPGPDGRLAASGWTDEPDLAGCAGGDNPLVLALAEAGQNLIIALAGTNAHPDLLSATQHYVAALAADEVSIALVFTRGIALENAARVVRDEILADNRPPLPPDAQRHVGTLLDLHATFIGSTATGRELIAATAAYRMPQSAYADLRVATQHLADAVAQAPALFADSAAQAAREAARDVGVGPHPERSTWSSLLTIRNIAAGALCLLGSASVEILKGLITSAFNASAPGAAVIAKGGVVVTAAWQFILGSVPDLQVIASALGHDARWLSSVTHIFSWIRARAKL